MFIRRGKMETAESLSDHGIKNTSGLMKLMNKMSASPYSKGSVSVSGTGLIRLESPRPAMPDTKPILTGMAPCPALLYIFHTSFRL